MAYYSIYPQKDSTIYSHPDRKQMNTGHDEILELAKEKGSTDNKLYPSRILIQFKTEDIRKAYEIVGFSSASWVGSGDSPINNINDPLGSYLYLAKNPDSIAKFSASLELTSTEPINLTSTQNIIARIVSRSWDEGTGRYSNLPTGSNGCSWEFRNNTTEAQAWTTSSFAFGTTGSIMSSSLITKGGGEWYNVFTQSQGNTYPGWPLSWNMTQQFTAGASLDINIDTTHFVHKLMTGPTGFNLTPTVNGYPINIIENNGFIIMLPEVIENNVSHSLGILNYFSVDTHTIYSPKLTFKWDDSSHNKQSSAKQNGELSVSLYQNKKEYNQNDEAVIRVNVRDKYPTRTFSTTSNFLNVGYFTTSSFYSIRDAHTEREIIPFDDNNTKMSADSEGMFFKLYMKSFQPERYYRILFKHVNNESTTIYDDNYYFKVVR